MKGLKIMAHFAILNDDNVVQQVIVVSDANTSDKDGVEDESVGQAFIAGMLGQGNYVQTSYNNRMRKSYAVIGGSYDSSKDQFVKRRPYDSWSLDDDNNWKAPAEKPGRDYNWDEKTLSWKNRS